MLLLHTMIIISICIIHFVIIYHHGSLNLGRVQEVTLQTFNNNYSNGNLQLSFPEKVPSETDALQLAYTAYPAYTESYMLHILLYD